MIDVKPLTGAGVLEVVMSGKITEADYRDTLAPAMDAALEGHDRIRLLARIGPGFEGFSAGAALADARLGMRHWTGFDRIAVVTDVDWIENVVRLFGFALPGPVQVFDLDQEDEARRWMTEALGSIHMTDLGGGALQVQLRGRLDGAAYDQAGDRLDAFVRDNPDFRLLLDLREFDGWQGLAALADHFRLVRNHRHLPGRVAIVGDESWQKLAEKLLRHFVSARTRYFGADTWDAARAWIG